MNQQNVALGLRVLIIDDEPSICESLAGALTDEGCQVATAENGRQGLVAFKIQRPDLVFLDIWMPGMDGIATLQALREIDEGVPVVIMSGHATIDTAVRATKLGAFEVLEKPLDLERILGLVDQANQLKQKNLPGSIRRASDVDLVGTSSFVVQVKKQISVVGPKNAWVLITGENGTGKEVVARAIHNASPRADRPFVAINCAAIPDELIESELFGHERGAFTNAITTRKGRFELAHTGTIFLDEIGDMSIRTQAKILRILQEKVFERVGGHESITVDVRVIAATNKDLPEEIKAGHFREDLYYRLNVIPIRMKPLRERREDIVPLAIHFLKTMGEDTGRTLRLEDDAQQLLMSYDWPGNVRELKNAMERTVILVDRSEITAESLAWLTGSSEGEFNHRHYGSLKAAKSDFERTYILGKLEENDWNVSKTADALGIERSNLHRKLRSYEIDPKKLKG